MVSEIMGNTHVLLNGNNAVTNLYKQKDGDNLQQSFMWEVSIDCAKVESCTPL